MKKLNVIHVITDKNVGGAGRWLLNFLSSYDREKLCVKVILPEDSLLIKDINLRETEIIFISNLQELSYDKESVEKFKDVFLKEKPDIVHTHASLAARMGAKNAKVPVIVNTKHCMEDLSGGFLKKCARKSINKKYSNAVIAVSEAVKDSVIAGGTSEKMVKMIYNGVNPIKKAGEDEIKAFREKFGFSENDFVVGMAARLEEVKDYDTFIKAAYETRKVSESIKFIIMGAGSEEKRLKELAYSLNLSGTLVFSGFIHDMDLAMSSIDLNVLTSKSEAISLSLIEGMTIGIPAAGTNAGGIPEAINNGVTGELFDIGDSKALSEIIISLWKDTEKYKKYSEMAKKVSLEKFSPDKMCREIEKLYAELYYK